MDLMQANRLRLLSDKALLVSRTIWVYSIVYSRCHHISLEGWNPQFGDVPVSCFAPGLSSGGRPAFAQLQLTCKVDSFSGRILSSYSLQTRNTLSRGLTDPSSHFYFFRTWRQYFCLSWSFRCFAVHLCLFLLPTYLSFHMFWLFNDFIV